MSTILETYGSLVLILCKVMFQEYGKTRAVHDILVTVIFFNFREIMKLLLVCTNVLRKSRRAQPWADRWPRGAAPPTTRLILRAWRLRPPCSTPSMINQPSSSSPILWRPLCSTANMIYENMQLPAFMFYTQCHHPPCSTSNMIEQNINSQQDKNVPAPPTMFYTRYDHPELTITIAHVLHSPRLTVLRLP